MIREPSAEWGRRIRDAEFRLFAVWACSNFGNQQTFSLRLSVFLGHGWGVGVRLFVLWWMEFKERVQSCLTSFVGLEKRYSPCCRLFPSPLPPSTGSIHLMAHLNPIANNIYLCYIYHYLHTTIARVVFKARNCNDLTTHRPVLFHTGNNIETVPRLLG